MSIEFFDEEAATVKLLALVKSANSCDVAALSALETHLIGIWEYVRALESEDQSTDMMTDLEYELSEILNDSDFRAVSGRNASKCSELFLLIMKYCCPLNENIEVVLALNKHIPLSIVEKLEESNFHWEEDGTTQALARTTTNPDLLRRLANSKENSTRYEVSANVNTPSEVLTDLIKDPDISDSLWYRGEGFPLSLIQYAVVSNPNTPAEALLEIVSGRLAISSSQFSIVDSSSPSKSQDVNPDDNEWEDLLDSLKESADSFPQIHQNKAELEKSSLLLDLEEVNASIVNKAKEMMRAKGYKRE